MAVSTRRTDRPNHKEHCATPTNRPILGDLSLTVEDGTTLTARTDVTLAEQWARHTLGEAWDSLTYGEQVRHTSEALAELRRAHNQTEETSA